MRNRGTAARDGQPARNGRGPGQALTVSDLAVRYGGVSAVRSVSFTVAPGQAVGLDRRQWRWQDLHAGGALMGLVPRAAGVGAVR